MTKNEKKSKNFQVPGIPQTQNQTKPRTGNNHQIKEKEKQTSKETTVIRPSTIRGERKNKPKEIQTPPTSLATGSRL